MIFDYISQLRDYVAEQLNLITKKSIDRKKEDPKAFEVHFADGVADDLAALLAKTDEDLEREELESRNHTIGELDKFNGPVLQIFSNGLLYDDLMTRDKLGIPEEATDEELESMYGFEPTGDGRWRWRSSWTDVHFYFGEEQPWMSIVQTEASNKNHYDFDMKINNECMAEAFQEKDTESIKYYQKEELRYKDLRDNKVHFRTITLPDEPKFNNLDSSGIIEGTRIWLSSFYPRLKDIAIEIVSDDVWSK